jgi:hypothetical protein
MASSSHSNIEFQSDYQDRASYTAVKSNRTIAHRLCAYPTISEEIRIKADAIYSIMKPKQFRDLKLIQQMYWCCYCAHLELGLDVNAKALGQHFGLSATDVNRCPGLFSPLETGYEPPKVLISPLNYLPGFCNHPKLNLNAEATEQCLQVAQRIMEKQPQLIRDSPSNVAAGILKYYLTITGIQHPDLREIVRISDSTITPWYKKVDQIDNQSTVTSQPILAAESASSQTPQIQSPQIQTLQIQSPQIQSPQIQTLQIQSPQIQTPQIQPWSVQVSGILPPIFTIVPSPASSTVPEHP